MTIGMWIACGVAAFGLLGLGIALGMGWQSRKECPRCAGREKVQQEFWRAQAQEEMEEFQKRHGRPFTIGDAAEAEKLGFGPMQRFRPTAVKPKKE